MSRFGSCKHRIVFERHINLGIRNLDIQVQETSSPQWNQPDLTSLLHLPLIPSIHPLLNPLDPSLAPSKSSILPQRPSQHAQPPIDHRPCRQRRESLFQHTVYRLDQFSELPLTDPLGQDLRVHVLQCRVQVPRDEPIAMHSDDARRAVERRSG